MSNAAHNHRPIDHTVDHTAARMRERHKIRADARADHPVQHDHTFVPFVVEDGGRLGLQALDLPDRLARRAAQHSGDGDPQLAARIRTCYCLFCYKRGGAATAFGSATLRRLSSTCLYIFRIIQLPHCIFLNIPVYSSSHCLQVCYSYVSINTPTHIPKHLLETFSNLLDDPLHEVAVDRCSKDTMPQAW